jgi:plastocyanin
MKIKKLQKPLYSMMCLFAIVLSLAIAPLIASAADHTIVVFDNYLSSDKININVGDTVIWTNSGTVPKMIEADTAQGGCSEPGGLHVVIEPGQSYSHTFTVPVPCNYTVKDLTNSISA